MANKEDVKDIKDDVKKFKALEAVGSTEGGKLLIKSVLKDIDSAIATLIGSYKTASDSELRAACATLAANYALYNVLNGASDNKKIAMADLKEAQSL